MVMAMERLWMVVRGGDEGALNYWKIKGDEDEYERYISLVMQIYLSPFIGIFQSEILLAL